MYKLFKKLFKSCSSNNHIITSQNCGDLFKKYDSIEIKEYYDNFKKTQDEYWNNEVDKYLLSEKLNKEVKRDEELLKICCSLYYDDYGCDVKDRVKNIKLRLKNNKL